MGVPSSHETGGHRYVVVNLVWELQHVVEERAEIHRA